MFDDKRCTVITVYSYKSLHVVTEIVT